MRPDVKFSTGELVTAEHLVRSWARLRAIMADRRSRSGLWEMLGDGGSRSGRFPGIEFGDSELTMSFREPMPNLLDIIDSPVYGVVHPSCISAVSQSWGCGREAVSSGPYEIRNWGPDSLELSLRRDFPEDLRSQSPVESFRVIWGSSARAGADLIYGSSADGDVPPGLSYWGGMESGITFIRCQSWSDPKSVCARPGSRRALRSAFRSELVRRGHRPASGFFPEMMTRTVETPDEPPAGRQIRPGTEVRVRPPTAHLQFFLQTTAALEAAIVRLGLKFKAVEVPRETLIKEFAPGLPSYHSDLVFVSTEITLDNRDFSVRYMFGSAEGIRLPDPTGRAARHLKRDPIDFSALNRVLWDDAIIWPVRHNSFGMWARAGLDFSQVNLAIASTPIVWIARRGGRR